jgi:hypothetical protein
VPYVTKQAGLGFYRNGEVVRLPAGAQVPEAESLPNFSAMMRIGQLAFVDAGGGDLLEQANERERKVAQAQRDATVAEARKPKTKRKSA